MTTISTDVVLVSGKQLVSTSIVYMSGTTSSEVLSLIAKEDSSAVLNHTLLPVNGIAQLPLPLNSFVLAEPN